MVAAQGCSSRHRGGRLELFERFVSASRHRNLGADDVTELAYPAFRRGGVLRDPHQPDGPVRGQVVGDRRRIIGTAEAAVQVDLGETSGDIGRHQDFGVLHRLLCR